MNERTKYIRTRDDKFIFFCATMNHSDSGVFILSLQDSVYLVRIG